MKQSQREFPVTIFQESIHPVNDVLSRARCRIFYLGLNRNGSYIDETFAKELISTLHYVPIKGIFDGDDYGAHGKHTDGRIYGIVPADNNFAWEQFTDDNGKVHTYACTDVLLFTALYPEAGSIVGKGQSMELYPPSLKYHYSLVDGQQCVVFEHGSFLGLQVLGDAVEPCFEDASFFSLQSSIEDIINKINQIGGEQEMHINFNTNNEQFTALWALLNPTEDEECTYKYSICSLDESEALVFNLESNKFERVNFSVNEEGQMVIDSTLEVENYVFTAEQAECVNQLSELNGGNFDTVNEEIVCAHSNAEQLKDSITKIEETNAAFATLQMEAQGYQAEVESKAAQITELEGKNNEFSARVTELEAQLSELNQYKHDVELAQKQQVIGSYVAALPSDVINSFQEKIESYATVKDLEKDIAYEVVKSGALLNHSKQDEPFVPKPAPVDGVVAILQKYTK